MMDIIISDVVLNIELESLQAKLLLLQDPQSCRKEEELGAGIPNETADADLIDDGFNKYFDATASDEASDGCRGSIGDHLFCKEQELLTVKELSLSKLQDNYSKVKDATVKDFITNGYTEAEARRKTDEEYEKQIESIEQEFLKGSCVTKLKLLEEAFQSISSRLEGENQGCTIDVFTPEGKEPSLDWHIRKDSELLAHLRAEYECEISKATNDTERKRELLMRNLKERLERKRFAREKELQDGGMSAEEASTQALEEEEQERPAEALKLEMLQKKEKGLIMFAIFKRHMSHFSVQRNATKLY